MERVALIAFRQSPDDCIEKWIGGGTNREYTIGLSNICEYAYAIYNISKDDLRFMNENILIVRISNVFD